MKIRWKIKEEKIKGDFLKLNTNAEMFFLGNVDIPTMYVQYFLR